ncbi:alpha-mannosidase [Natronospora cellulosivora (SeqCode)]
MNDILIEIKKEMIEDSYPITNWQKREAIYTGLKEYKYIGDWESFQIGDTWSEEEDTTTFFKATYLVPQEVKGKKVVLTIETGGEAALHINEDIYQGLDENHSDVFLDVEQYAGCEIDLLLEAALNRINKIYVPDPDYKHCFSLAELRIIKPEVETFYYNYLALKELSDTLKQRQEKEYNDINKIIERLELHFNKEDRNYVFLNKIYEEEIAALNKDESYFMSCFGHAHIDIAWLWQFKETLRKAGRSFSTAVRLMERYPEFNFIQSQPQLYLYIKNYYPALYAEIKKKIKQGQWQPEGGMWVEADTNIPGGESLVRQFLYGKKFIKEEFGFDSKLCWLPDVFGYTGSLPQIMKKAEIDYFMTSKISWNDTNEFPYSIFHWQGIDGSKVLTHIPRVILPFTYNGEVYADKVLKVKDNYQQQKEKNVFEYKFGDSSNYFKKDRVIPDDKLFYIYGYGDGGGGVTQEFIEKIKRFDKLSKMPRMKFSQPKQYFQELEKDIQEQNTKYPDWKGELYFEYHRGTYTSQAKTKLNNRRAELKIQNAEILSFLTGVASQSKIQELWQQILTNQFHDIIPGTSINEVYQDVDQIYQKVQQELDRIIEDGLNRLAKSKLNSNKFFPAAIIDNKSNNKGAKLLYDQDSDYLIVWNGLGYQRNSLVRINIKEKWRDNSLQFIDYSTEETLEYDLDSSRDIIDLYVKDVPAMGFRIIKVDSGPELSKYHENHSPGIDKNVIVENSYFKLTFNNGQMNSIYDKKRELELISADRCPNELQFFDDRPPRYQAWEQVAEFEEHRIDEDMELLDFYIKEYKLKKVISIKRKFRESIFKQDIILYRDFDRIDFDNHVDWKEREVMVKVAFPVNVNSDQARYEIAYGNLTRSTSNNTDYEKAQFEVPGHRWVDLSQPGLGISLLNNCKYGYDVKGNQIRLTLLKAPNYPDEKADYGLHHFTYSFYVHDGVFYQSKILEYAEDLTNSLLVQEIDPEEQILTSAGFVEVEKGSSRLEVIKHAEDGRSIIMRMYEPYGARELVSLKLNSEIRIQSARIVNLLENHLSKEISFKDNILKFKMEPFEIKTIKLLI